MRTMIWAHRGASAYAPENSMEAFKLAYEMCADGIELDVHQTKDGYLVVAHDETVDRCSNGSGYIIDKNLSELLELDFSNGRRNYSNTRIPTLDQVLSFIKSSGMTLNIEVKNGIVIYKGIEEKILDLVAKYGLDNKVIYSSFNHHSLKVIKTLNPQAQIGVLYSEAMVDPYIYAKHLNATSIHPYYQTLMLPGTIEGCKNHGIKIHTWTVDKQDHIIWMLNEEVDAIITNHPDIAIKLRDIVQK